MRVNKKEKIKKVLPLSFLKGLSFLKNRVFPKTHLGLIFRKNISKTKKLELTRNISLERCGDVETIFTFGNKIKYSGWILTREEIKEKLEKAECWLAIVNQEKVGGFWAYHGDIEIKNFPGLPAMIFGKNKKIKLEEKTAYICHEFVQPEHRGQGIGREMLYSFINFLGEEDSFKKLIVSMGANNGSNIRKWEKVGAQLIGIVSIRGFLGLVFRKEIFLDQKEKCWS